MKFIKYISLTLIILVSNSCTKDFLDTTSPFGIPAVDYYTTEEHAQAALTACYDVLSANFDRLYGLGIDAIGVYAGDLAMSGRVNPRSFLSIENNTQTGDEFTLELIWKECYAGIYRCNVFLERVEGIEFEEASLKSRMIAEATFLRGYFHFELMRVFGGVPIATKVLTIEEAMEPRNSKAEVVSQIISDFSDAIPALLASYGGSNKGRITQGAAQAYLTKLYVYEKDWSNAVSVGANVLNSGQYGLHDNYFDNFSVAHENGMESILEVQCKTTGTAPLEGNAHYDLESFDSDIAVNPRGYTAPLRNFTDSFEKNADGNTDPRKDLTADFNIISVTLFGSVKYVQPQPEKPVVQYDGELNYKLMRYADFLLLYAEALNESGDTQGAIDLINQVRQRPSVNMTPLSGLNQQQTRQAIYDERKWELGLEGHRYFDLVRWGIAGEVLRGLDRRFVDGVHEVQPIPINQINLNPNLEQNPGY